MKHLRRGPAQGEQEAPWTLETLRVFLESRIDALQDHLAAKFEYADKAIDKAEQQMNARLAGMNEFRDQLKDQASKFASTDRLDEIKGGIDARLKILENQISNWQGRITTFAAIWGLIVMIVSALVNYFVRTFP